MIINVREFLGENFGVEDAIVLREEIANKVDNSITLDFNGVEKVSSTFLTCLFSQLINKKGREEIFNNVSVKNLANYNDYSRVVLGTTWA